MNTPQQFCISQKFFFDAAHTLRRDIETEGSLRVHGHTYYAEVSIAGTPDAQSGMVVDLGRVRQRIELLRPQLDHRLLDDVPGLGPATRTGGGLWKRARTTMRIVLASTRNVPATRNACRNSWSR